MTQKELAEKLHTTAKTISNWERNKNAIPSGMISTIAKELDIDREFLLNISIKPDRIYFFYCPVCKSVVWSYTNSSHVCCGKHLKPLIPAPETSNHYMYTETNSETGFIKISTYHPQTPDHRIEFVAYVSENDVHIFACLGNKPLDFLIPHSPGGKIYFFCSKHGLFHDGMFY